MQLEVEVLVPLQQKEEQVLEEQEVQLVDQVLPVLEVQELLIEVVEVEAVSQAVKVDQV